MISTMLASGTCYRAMSSSMERAVTSLASAASSGHYFNWAYSDFLGGSYSVKRLNPVAVLPLPQTLNGKSVSQQGRRTRRAPPPFLEPIERVGVFSTRALFQRDAQSWIGDIGDADIDGRYTALSGSRFMHSIGFSSNGDTIGQGRRGFVHASYKLNSVLTANGFYTHAGGPMINNVNQQGITAGLIVDFKALVNTYKPIF